MVNVTYGILVAVIGAILALSFQLGKSKNRKMWTIIGIIGVIVGLMLPVLGVTGGLSLGGASGISTFSIAGSPAPTVGDTTSTGSATALCQFAPTASYVTIDNFGTTSVGGTAYYKANGQQATSTALTSVNKGVQYTYWVSNSSYYVEPKTITADCGSNVVQAKAFANGSASITAYDLVNKQIVTNGAYNTSVGANGIANIELTYTGTSKASAMPFGGVMVVEYNSTIASVTASGDAISDSTPFHVTYSPSATGLAYKVFGVSSALDDGKGLPKTINVQMQAGSSDLTVNSSAVTVKFIPANYYLTNAGNIALDVEKYANSDNTRTGIANTLQASWYFS